jgi:LysM repeat protein
VRQFISILLIAIVVFSAFSLQAQQDSNDVALSGNVQEVSGKLYFFHHVKAGQTLYSIARAYSVSQDMIHAANPDIELGLKADQIIIIPAFAHVAEPRETIFGISRLYGITVDQIHELNPDIKASGLKIAQKVFLPGLRPGEAVEAMNAPVSQQPYMPTSLPEDEVHKPPLTRHDSVMLELPSQRLGDMIKRAIPCEQAQPKQTYHIALLVPLFLNELSDRRGMDTLSYPTSVSMQSHKSFSFLPYYHGVLLAVDSIRNEGVDIRLSVFDVDEDEQKARRAVSSVGFADLDLIIGPFYRQTLTYVSNFAFANNIAIVSPLLADKGQLRGFPNLFKATPSLEAQLNRLADYISATYVRENIIIVHNNQPQAIPVISSFRSSLSARLRGEQGITMHADSLMPLPANLKEVIYIREGMSGLVSKFHPGKENIIITLINDEAFLSNYLRELNLHTRRYNISVFGIPDWKDYQSLEIDYLQNLKVHIFTPDFYDYTEEHIKDFVIKYRTAFKTEPAIDAFKGVQTTYFFLSALALYGKNFSVLHEPVWHVK